MIGGKVNSNPVVLEYLPDETNELGYNVGYGMLIMNKVEELEKKGTPVLTQTIMKELKIGKTTVNKHLQNFVKQGLLEIRKAKVQMNEANVTVCHVYSSKKRKTHGKKAKK